MKPLYNAEEMRMLDKRAAEDARVPGLVLMENAGIKTFQIILEKTGGIAGMSVTILCGKGNNGGDGFVIARHLLNHGAQVRVYLFAPADTVKGDARAMLDAWMGMGGELIDDVGDESSLKDLAEDLADSEVIVDALLGTGLESEVRAPMAEAIELMNDSPALIVAVDIPSGISADTGHVLGTAVQADVTCTYAGMKLGQWLYPGRAHCGELFEIEISIPFEMLDSHRGTTYLLTPEDVWSGLFHRLPDAHKGNFGHLLVVAGSHGKSGAGVLSCRAAHRIGAGLVSMAIPRGLESVVAPQSPETMAELLAQSDSGGYAPDAGTALLEATATRTAVLIGPGVPTDAESSEVLLELIRNCELPMVIDADGLNLLAHAGLTPGKLASEQVIVTPHPGEMSRLSGFTTREIQADRIGVATAYAAEHAVIVVLKGAGTVIALPDGQAMVCPAGNAGLATGGTGDVLAGLIAGLLVQEAITPIEAAATGVLLHGMAADRISGRGSEASLIASDVIAEIPALIADVHEELHHHHAHAVPGEGEEYHS